MSNEARIEANGTCLDCGCVVATGEQDTHQRFHAILNAHARAIAVMVNQLPDDVRERALRGNDNNWSLEAFEEVTGISAGSDKGETT